jgi:hypothetical protein
VQVIPTDKEVRVATDYTTGSLTGSHKTKETTEAMKRLENEDAISEDESIVF